ncbi:MAG: DUF2478 domain-containing protein [Xanthobacteraceae bacterium]|nr:MAG: DUF2478 domain-containing protein [Xanthobacteraceae bacterium]
MFDSQSDLAALVYGPGDAPDCLLRDFAMRLQCLGYRPIGLVQRGGYASVAHEVVPAITLPRMTPIPLRHCHTLHSAGCHLDAGHIAEMKRKLSAAIKNTADVVIINRFGKLEAEGAGFIDLIREAAAVDLPIVIAVAAVRFMSWTQFSQGMGIKLRCTPQDLDNWWQTIAPLRRACPPQPALTFCEIVK